MRSTLSILMPFLAHPRSQLETRGTTTSTPRNPAPVDCPLQRPGSFHVVKEFADIGEPPTFPFGTAIPAKLDR